MRIARSLTVIVPLLTLAVLVFSSPPAGAVPGLGCVPLPLPSGPGANQSFSMTVQYGDDSLRATLWRQRCQDSEDVVLLLRAAPVSPSSLLCASRWFLEQDLSRFEVSFRSRIAPAEEGPEPPFCSTIYGPVTVVVEASGLWSGEAATFAPTDDFFVLYLGATENENRYVAYRIEIPYPLPELPLPVSSAPSVAIVATGCSPCRPGQVVGYRVDVTNPDVPLRAEYRGGARLADGSILSFVQTSVTIPHGASTLALVPALTLPAGLKAQEVYVEAALLEPGLGVTIARGRVKLQLLP